MPLPVESFADAAAAFCAWCEQPARGDSDTDARTAIRHLSRLYSLALELRIPPDPDPDLDGEGTDAATSRAVFERCSELPFSVYSVVFDPHVVPPEKPVVGDLGVDLAEIHSELVDGLTLHRAGHVTEAECEWRESFELHWGRHASSALRALHCWYADGGGW